MNKPNQLAILVNEASRQVSAEMAGKVGAVLMRFHQDYVEPLESEVRDLEDRVLFLELPWYLKSYYRLIRRPKVQAFFAWVISLRRKNADRDGVGSAEGSASESGGGAGVSGSEPDGSDGAAGVPSVAPDNAA